MTTIVVRLVCSLSLLIVAVAEYAPHVPASTDEYKQPTWDRGTTDSQVQSLMQAAAQLHQDGELDDAVKNYKQVVQKEPKNAEAYESLSKVLYDQKKDDLAHKAHAKAVKIHHAMLAKQTLF